MNRKNNTRIARRALNANGLGVLVCALMLSACDGNLADAVDAFAGGDDAAEGASGGEGNGAPDADGDAEADPEGPGGMGGAGSEDGENPEGMGGAGGDEGEGAGGDEGEGAGGDEGEGAGGDEGEGAGGDEGEGAGGDEGEGAGGEGGMGGGEPEPEPAARTLGLNDLAILLPGANNNRDFRNAPRLADVGRGGALLPRAVFDRLPALLPTPPPAPPGPPGQPPAPGLTADDIYNSLRVMAVRIDPCFQGVTGDPCQAMIRLVAQPTNAQGAALDAGVHLFYPMGDAEFAGVVHTLRDLRPLSAEANIDGPLAVHPALRAQGLGGAYGQALVGLLMAETGAERLSQVTFMTREPNARDRWTFGGFTVQNARSVPPQMRDMVIPEIENTRQTVDLAPPTPQGFRFNVTPLGMDHGRIQPLLDARTAGQASAAAKSEALGALRLIENPHQLPVGEVQCASCHLAAFVGDQAETRFGAVSDVAAFEAAGIDLRITGTAHRNPRSLRAFGWFDDQAAISPRVVHDTAVALLALEARFPAR